jgi:ABC-type sugar transport system ATPase subunit
VDFEELEGLCDRVLVVSEGRIVAELNAPDIDHHRLAALAFGKNAA